MDIATLVGIVGAFALVIISIVLGQADPLAAIMGFVDAPSVMITIGGTMMALMASYKMKDFVAGLKSIGVPFKQSKIDQIAIISKIIELSNVARKEGLLALEEVAASLEDPFMKKGILLIVDGTEPELVRGIMETEMEFMDARHAKMSGFWKNLAAMGPAWGMIGTLVGLINMLAKLSDMAAVGPNMAVALITTFYGSLIANWIGTPVSNKMDALATEEYESRTLVVEGLLSIQAGENPRVIEEKLKSFLSPKEREGINSEDGAGGE